TRTENKVFFNFSGFVVSLHGMWIWVTAGHVLQRLDRQIDSGELEILHSNLADYFGQGHDVGVGIPFNYREARRWTVDDDARGLDIAIVPLSEHYERLLTANGIVPLPQHYWDFHDSIEYDAYGILGFPEEMHSHERSVDVTGATIFGGVRAVL